MTGFNDNFFSYEGHVPVHTYASFMIVFIIRGVLRHIYGDVDTVGENNEQYFYPTWVTTCSSNWPSISTRALFDPCTLPVMFYFLFLLVGFDYVHLTCVEVGCKIFLSYVGGSAWVGSVIFSLTFQLHRHYTSSL